MENLFNKLFPLKCVNCNQVGEIICDNCLYDCELLTTQYCVVCDKPSFDGFTHKECLKKKPYSPIQVISIYNYANTIRHSIKTSKYGTKQFLALKKVTYEGIRILKEWEYMFEDYICVAIPSTKSKYIRRGFNQSEIITEILSKQLKLQIANNIFIRNKETKAQYYLKRGDRFENVKDAFTVNRSKNIKGKKILLVDDIVTTGATLLEASKILYESGVKDVRCFTLSKKFKDSWRNACKSPRN